VRAAWIAASRRLPALVHIALVVWLTTGCATLRAYDGPRRPPAEIATLGAAPLPGFQISLRAIDSKPLRWSQDRIELLPGTYEITAHVLVSNWRKQLEFVHELTLTVEAGHAYLMYAEIDAYGPRTFVVDQDRLDIVAEQKGPPVEPTPTPPPTSLR
jgi:hypothetical protein